MMTFETELPLFSDKSRLSSTGTSPVMKSWNSVVVGAGGRDAVDAAVAGKNIYYYNVACNDSFKVLNYHYPNKPNIPEEYTISLYLELVDSCGAWIASINSTETSLGDTFETFITVASKKIIFRKVSMHDLQFCWVVSLNSAMLLYGREGNNAVTIFPWLNYLF